jgi:hypothetical protein
VRLALLLVPIVVIAAIAVVALLSPAIRPTRRTSPVPDLIEAPWTTGQVAALNAFQCSGRMHPFACGGRHQLHQKLTAEVDGWRCPDETCDYRQTWAHAFMGDADVVAALIACDPLQSCSVAAEETVPNTLEHQ